MDTALTDIKTLDDAAVVQQVQALFVRLKEMRTDPEIPLGVELAFVDELRELAPDVLSAVIRQVAVLTAQNHALNKTLALVTEHLARHITKEQQAKSVGNHALFHELITESFGALQTACALLGINKDGSVDAPSDVGWTLTEAQRAFLDERKVEIDEAFSTGDMQALRDLAGTADYGDLFGDMSFDEAYDRYSEKDGGS